MAYLLAMSIVIGFFGICSCTAIYSVFKIKNGLTFVDVVLASLFLSNLLAAAFGYTREVFSYVGTKFASDEQICEVSAFVVMLMAVTINHVVALGAHRYIQVMKPFMARQLNARIGTATWCVLVAWLSGIPVCIPPLLGWGRFSRVKGQQIFGLDYSIRSLGNNLYLAYATIFSFLLPVTSACYCLKIAWSKKDRFHGVIRRRYILTEISCWRHSLWPGCRTLWCAQ